VEPKRRFQVKMRSQRNQSGPFFRAESIQKDREGRRGNLKAFSLNVEKRTREEMIEFRISL